MRTVSWSLQRVAKLDEPGFSGVQESSGTALVTFDQLVALVGALNARVHASDESGGTADDAVPLVNALVHAPDALVQSVNAKVHRADAIVQPLDAFVHIVHRGGQPADERVSSLYVGVRVVYVGVHVVYACVHVVYTGVQALSLDVRTKGAVMASPKDPSFARLLQRTQRALGETRNCAPATHEHRAPTPASVR